MLISITVSSACKSQHSLRPWDPKSKLQVKQPIPSFACHRLNCGNCGFHVAATQHGCQGAVSATRTVWKASSFHSAPAGLRVGCEHRRSRASPALKRTNPCLFSSLMSYGAKHPSHFRRTPACCAHGPSFNRRFKVSRDKALAALSFRLEGGPRGDRHWAQPTGAALPAAPARSARDGLGELRPRLPAAPCVGRPRPPCEGGGLWPLALGSECGGSASETARASVSVWLPGEAQPSVPPPMSSLLREQLRR